MDHIITFIRLNEISLDELIQHMSDPRVARHMPLQDFTWDNESAANFISAKEQYWQKDGLGHWAILSDSKYVGWGGFQKEGQDWDFGLVLKPEYFGLGPQITEKAVAFAKQDKRMPFITFLLPLSRKNLKALDRLGAYFVKEIQHEGVSFLKYQLDTDE